MPHPQMAVGNGLCETAFEAYHIHVGLYRSADHGTAGLGGSCTSGVSFPRRPSSLHRAKTLYHQLIGCDLVMLHIAPDNAHDLKWIDP